MKKNGRNSKSSPWRLLLILLALFFSQNLSAQTITATGTVIDEKNEPIPGVSVLVKGTSKVAITDQRGNFSIQCPSGSTLHFTFIGFKDVDQVVSDKRMKITLADNTNGLNEVIVVGYGTQKKGSVTGSITSVDVKAIADIPTASLANILAGRLTGVQIATTTGKPGSGSSLNIRAKGTINNSDPLYVIDGAVRDKGAFDALDPSEVSNVSVLKDGASAAVYGSRAANGVVLITTRKGGNSAPIVTYSGTVGIDDPTMIPKTLSSYEQAIYLNDYNMVTYLINGGVDPRTTPKWYADDELEHFKNYNYSYIDAAWKTPFTTRHALNVSGGSDKVRYFIAGSLYDATGSFENLKFSKYNFRANVDVNVTKNLTLGLNLSTDNRRDRKPFWPSDGDRDAMDNLYLGFLWRSKMNPGIIDGKYVQHNGQEQNPLALISEEHGSNTRKWQNVNANVYAEYKVPYLDGLKLKLQYNRSIDNRLTKIVSLPYDMYNFKAAGTNGHYIDPSNQVIGTYTHALENYIRKENRLDQDYQLNFYATYDKTIRKHDISALFVYEQSEAENETFDARRNNLIIWSMPEFFAASPDASQSIVGAGGLGEEGRLSYVGRLNYAYDSKYLLEGAFRIDGSTKFAPNNRWGFFPSVSAGWRISREAFFSNNIKFVNDLKLRASVATLGNDAVGGWDWMPKYNVTTGAVFDAQNYGLIPGVLPNPDLTWEKSTSYNLGFDSRLLNNKVDFTAEYFFRHTYDILDTRSASVSTSFGASLPKENYSIINAHGFEFELGYHDGIGKDFSYSVSGNFSYAKSQWVKRDEAANQRPYLSEIRQTINREWGYESVGIIRTQEQLDKMLADYPNMSVLGQKPVLGMIMYKDVRGPNSDTPDGTITVDDKVVIRKQTIPPISYGLSLGAKWKGFGLDVLFQGLAGYEKIISERGSLVKDWNSTFQFRADHWTPENPNATMPSGMNNKNTELSTFWVYNASFIRCKNIMLTYDIPASATKSIGLNKVKLFVNGTNLFLLENHLKWNDPELYNVSSYPIMKNYSLGVNVTF